MKPILLICCFFWLVSCKNSENTGNPGQNPVLVSDKTAHSEAFNRSFELLLDNYFNLSKGFYAQNDSLINQSARQLSISADSLALKELKVDSLAMAACYTYQQGIVAEIKGLLGEPVLLEKRKSFQLISDQLYELIREIGYDRKKIYHFFCQEAFSDQGAFWLSERKDAENPYRPSSGSNCAEIKDSINLVLSN
ncbi:MAG: hypothetical protein RLZZ28_176 [Bacteroidota bacterium]|jgi:Cu(I)/Ag(I) efflux system membrane fusion protein